LRLSQSNKTALIDETVPARHAKGSHGVESLIPHESAIAEGRHQEARVIKEPSTKAEKMLRITNFSASASALGTSILISYLKVTHVATTAITDVKIAKAPKSEGVNNLESNGVPATAIP
jgi:hypothetical protein